MVGGHGEAVVAHGKRQQGSAKRQGHQDRYRLQEVVEQQNQDSIDTEQADHLGQDKAAEQLILSLEVDRSSFGIEEVRNPSSLLREAVRCGLIVTLRDS